MKKIIKGNIKDKMALGAGGVVGATSGAIAGTAVMTPTMSAQELTDSQIESVEEDPEIIEAQIATFEDDSEIIEAQIATFEEGDHHNYHHTDNNHALSQSSVNNHHSVSVETHHNNAPAADDQIIQVDEITPQQNTESGNEVGQFVEYVEYQESDNIYDTTDLPDYVNDGDVDLFMS